MRATQSQSSRRHRLATRISKSHPLAGKKVYVPTMAYGSTQVFCAALRALGIDARLTPPSDERTRELGAKFTCGDECYPAKVTVGDFLKVIEQPDFDARQTVFFMPTAEGPCRFGQYAPYLKKLVRDLGFPEVEILSPTSANAYAGLGDMARAFVRTGWRALLTGDILLKLLLKTRPYESRPGESDRVYEACLDDLSGVLENTSVEPGVQLEALVRGLIRARDRFRAIPAAYNRDTPLIGIVGEIFCRLNNFSNDDMVRRIEGYGGECWMSDIAEWIWYTNSEEARRLKLVGRSLSFAMLANKIRSHVQRSDEHALLRPFREDFQGYEEPQTMAELMKYAEPYLPQWGAMGEMVLNTGKAIYLARKGADGIVDISPFTCMNGIVSEAIYPVVSQANGGIPIRNFYFDGTQSDLDRDIGIYLELARAYQRRKNFPRIYPAYFRPATMTAAG